MDKKYFQVNFDGSVKAINKQAYLKKYDAVEAGDSDVILWYDDGVNIFIGHCACDEKKVAEWIKNNIGEFNPDCWMAGDYSLENVLE